MHLCGLSSVISKISHLDKSYMVLLGFLSDIPQHPIRK